MSGVKRYWISGTLREITDGNFQGHDVVMAYELDRVTAERDALQERLNAADQKDDDLSFQLKDREGSRRDWFEEVQRLQAELDKRPSQIAMSLQTRIKNIQAKLAERDALLAEVYVSVTGRNGTFARIPADWFDRRDALSANAEPSAPVAQYPNRLCHIDYTAHPYRCGCLRGDNEAQRIYDEHMRSPVERDERADYEDWAHSNWPGAQRQQLERDAFGLYKNPCYRDFWTGWQARAALDSKATHAAGPKCKTCNDRGSVCVDWEAGAWSNCSECKATEGASHE